MRAFLTYLTLLTITFTALSVTAQNNKHTPPQLSSSESEAKKDTIPTEPLSEENAKNSDKPTEDKSKPTDNQQKTDTTQPAPKTLKAEDLKVTVLQLKNKVAYRENPEAKWKHCKPGMVIPLTSDISTGLRSTVKLQLGPNITIDLGSLTIVTVARLTIDDKHILKTDIYKKYGELIFDVKPTTEFKNDLKIHTPGAVTAVKGTGGLHQSFGAQSKVINFNGTFSVDTPYGPQIPFTSGDSGSNNQSYSQRYKQNQQQAQYGAAPNQNTRSPSSMAGADKTLTSLYNGWDAWRTTMMEFEQKRKGNNDGGQNAYTPNIPETSYTPPRQVD